MSAHHLALLRVAVADFDKLTKDGEHIAAMFARLYRRSEVRCTRNSNNNKNILILRFMETNKKQEVREIVKRISSLIDENGPVYVWDNEGDETSNVRHFGTKENAREFVSLKKELFFLCQLSERSFVIGTEEEYQKAFRDVLKLKRARQVKDYSAYVDEQVKIKQYEIKALKALLDVCQKFDGKVINKRFTDAVSEASGLHCSFAENYECALNMEYFGNDYGYNLKPSVRIFGSKREEHYGAGRLLWRWAVGDRLEAGTVVDIIAPYINDRLKRIDELNATKKQYSGYLKLAEKAAKLIRELNEYDYVVQEWACRHDTETGVGASKVWRY